MRDPQERFRGLENVSQCVKMLKKRIFISAEFLKAVCAYTREELFSENPFFVIELRKGFVEKYPSFTVSYETINGFAINPMKSWFCMKPATVSYETVNDRYFPTKPFFQIFSKKNVFQQKVLPVDTQGEPLRVR